jgi:hypothetical protein
MSKFCCFVSPKIACLEAAINRLVAGSSPARGANWNKGLGEVRLAPCFFTVPKFGTYQNRLS